MSWTGLPQVHLNHNALITGDRNAYWIDWMRDRYFNHGVVGDALSLHVVGSVPIAFSDDPMKSSLSASHQNFRHRAAELASTVNLALTVSYIASDSTGISRLTVDSSTFSVIAHIEALEWVLDQAQAR